MGVLGGGCRTISVSFLAAGAALYRPVVCQAAVARGGHL
jgi:hypothetical protein